MFFTCLPFHRGVTGWAIYLKNVPKKRAALRQYIWKITEDFKKDRCKDYGRMILSLFFFDPKENYNGSSPHFPNGYLKMCSCIPTHTHILHQSRVYWDKSNEHWELEYCYDISLWYFTSMPLLLKHFRQSVWKTIHHNLKLGLSVAHCDCPLCSFLHLLSWYYS